jgi:hypothetical protein
VLLLHCSRPQATTESTDEPELSHTLVRLTGTMAQDWPVHARRCLHRLPEQLHWAVPLLDPDHPSLLACTHEQARELLLWLHHLPSYEHPIVGCHRHRPA